jgi:hypothetical protein
MSTRWTVKPVCAATCAMPEPIKPAPMTVKFFGAFAVEYERRANAEIIFLRNKDASAGTVAIAFDQSEYNDLI